MITFGAFCGCIALLWTGCLTVSASNYAIPVTDVTASSYQSGYEPAKASDRLYDHPDNKWMANAAPSSADPQWIKLDLGSVKYVGAIEIYPDPGYGPKAFTFETSEDDAAYTVRQSVGLDEDKRTFHSWTPAKARYVKIKMTEGFGGQAALREVYLFSDILPHRVASLSAGDLYDFSRLTNAGFDALKKANIQLVNAIVVGYAPGYKVQVLPDGGDPRVEANYDWEYTDEMVKRFTDYGIDMFIGQNIGLVETKWPQLNSPLIDEYGSQTAVTVRGNPFASDYLTFSSAFDKKMAEHFSDNPYVRLQQVMGPGYFGGMEIFGGDIVHPSLYVYDDQAKARFREWLQKQYAGIAALNAAWGTSYNGWSDVQPPLPQRTNMPLAYDDRQSWSDLMFWLRDYMTNFIRQSVSEVRSATDKPLYVEIDGAHMFSPMESQANVGLVARAVSDYKPFVLASSSADEVFGPAAIAAAARFHGFDTAMDNANYESRKLSDDTMFGLLAKGIGTFNNSNMAEDFNGSGWTGTGWDPSGSYTPGPELQQFARKSERLLAVDPLPEQSEVAIYNSFYSSNYRKGYRYDDYMNIYDRDHGVGFNVRPFASWAHYLDTPDIIDDFLIEDGALAGYKLLVTANSSLTLTSDAAQSNLLNWVSSGNAIVGFGKDSFNYKLNLSSRSVSGGTGVSSWMMGISGGSAASSTSSRKASVAANKPAWLKSLKAGETAAFTVSDSSQAQAFTSLLSGATPVLVDGNGNTLMAEYTYGSGKVLFCTIPVNDSEMFYDSFMGKILSDFADYAGVTRKISYDGDRFHVAYMGTNKKDDSKLVVAADLQYMANGQYLSKGATAEPQYMGNGQTLSIQTYPSLNGSSITVDITAPWNNIIGGTIQEGSLDLPQKRIQYTASSSQPLILHALLYGSLPITNVTAGMYEKPYIPNNVSDGSKDDAGFWKGGSASANNPQTITADLGAVYPVSGMELYPYTDDDENELFSFETGSYDGWSISGAAFGTAPSSGTHDETVTGIKGMYWADSRWGGDASASTLQSPNFMIDKDVLSFRMAGYDGPNGTNNENYIFLKRASDNAILISVKPPQSDHLTVQRLEVAKYIGTEVYLQVADNCTASSYGWLGIDSVSLSSYKENKEIADFSFETGTYSGWTVSGTAFGSAPVSSDHGGLVKGWRGKYWADSKTGGDTAAGTLTSDSFIPEKELLTFRIAGYDGALGNAGKNIVYLKRTSDNAILLSAKPPQSDIFTDVTWDVTAYMGVSVYMEVVDGNTDSSYGWLGIDNVSLSSNYGFERGTYAGWTVNGTGFGTAPTYQKTDQTLLWGRNIIPIPGYDGKYYATTHVAGNAAVGSLVSKNFVIEKPVLSFRGAGYDGPNGTNNQNYYWLMRASDDKPLIVGKPPQDSRFVQYYWDVSDFIGTEVYFKVEDNNASDDIDGWIAFDDLMQLNNFDFETGNWAGWTTAGTAFGSNPTAESPSGSVSGYRGTHYAASYSNGNAATGSITSDSFIVENGIFSFRKAGYDGPAGTNNQNFFYLRRASDDAILFSAKPPQSDSFVLETWDVSDYIGTKVYFQAVDGETDSWLGVDDINWRGAGPRSFTVHTSIDGVNWGTPVLTVADQGNRYENYSWTPTEARYVKLSITDAYASNVMIKELTFKKNRTPLPIAAAAASSEAVGYPADKAIDGITESDTDMWVSIGAAPAWLQLDLGSAKTVQAVEIFARNSSLAQKLGPQSFTIETSTNGTAWTTVYTAKNNGENDVTYTFPPINARYIKINITSGWNDTSQIREVKVF